MCECSFTDDGVGVRVQQWKKCTLFTLKFGEPCNPISCIARAAPCHQVAGLTSAQCPSMASFWLCELD